MEHNFLYTFFKNHFEGALRNGESLFCDYLLILPYHGAKYLPLFISILVVSLYSIGNVLS